MSVRSALRVIFSFLFGCWLLAICGCTDAGPELGQVSGTIKLDGEPVAGATVTFLPMFEGGVDVTSEPTDESGSYTMQYSVDRPGVLLGEHQVQVSTMDWIKNEVDGSNKVVPERIPKQYCDIDSELRFTVQAGDNDASFDLSTDR